MKGENTRFHSLRKKINGVVEGGGGSVCDKWRKKTK